MIDRHQHYPGAACLHLFTVFVMRHLLVEWHCKEVQKVTALVLQYKCCSKFLPLLMDQEVLQFWFETLINIHSKDKLLHKSNYLIQNKKWSIFHVELKLPELKIYLANVYP